MVLEVKTVVPIDFYKVKANECIELLIYCEDIQERGDVRSTDRKVWHVLKLVMKDNRLQLQIIVP